MNISRLETLCKGFGVSSAESMVSGTIREAYKPLCDELLFDRLGSVFALKKSKKETARTLMIAAPLDEVGLMISEVKDNGEIVFIQLENVAPSSLLHQRVRILTRDNQCLDGVIGMNKKALEDKCEVKSADDLVIRCGLYGEELKEKVRPGDLVSYSASFCEQNGILFSKALFPRVLNEITIGILERMKDAELDYHLAVGGIAQSVIGYRGTKTATYVVRPDAAIALTAFDTAGGKASLKNGPIVGYYDRQMLPSQLFLKDFTAAAEAKAYFGNTGNDGSFIHKTLKGTPAISLGLAVDNLGTAAEMCSSADIQALTDCLCAYLETLTSEKISAFGFGE